LNPQEIFLRSDDPYPTIGSVSDQNKTALVKALVLAVTAPSQKLANDCVQIGEAIATRLTKEEVENCKQVAEEMLEENHQETESKYAINGDETFEEV
jgi:hypothetical protein